jgi:hypothetical protein
MNDSKDDGKPHPTGSHRLIENGHILLWLIKDTCWALEWKALGIFMIIPTVSVAFYLLWRSRQSRSESYHNLAVCFWILANSIWMLGEFNDADLRPVSAGLFITGLLILGAYYLFFFRKDVKAQKEPAKEKERSAKTNSGHTNVSGETTRIS